jgi:patatin-like phospholipase/acyl hydrolase
VNETSHERCAARKNDRRDAIRNLGLLGIGGVATSLIGAPESQAATERRRSKPYRILVFVGGGIRGIASAKMLSRLTQRHPRLLVEADLLAGCSIGAQIVSQLLAKRSPAQIYQNLSTSLVRFFSHPNNDPSKPAFSIDAAAIAQRLLHPRNPRLRDLDRKVLLTAFDVRGSRARTWQPLLLNNLAKSTNADTRLIDAVVSSGAMPGMLGSWKGHIDGAFVNHDPSLAAIALAVNEGVPLADITLICFGTGLMNNWIASDTSTNLIPTLTQMMLGERYAYLNRTLDRFIAEDDTNPADLAYLTARAERVDLAHASAVVRRYWSGS